MHLLNRLLTGLILVVCCSAHAARAEEDAPAVRLGDRLAQVSSIHAGYMQLAKGALGDELQRTEGELWVAAPSRFRVESKSMFGQVIVSDGESLWTWDQDLDQVIIQPLAHDIQQVPILLLSGNANDLESSYEVANYADEAGEHFVLTPKDPGSLFATLTIEFSGEDPKSIEIRDRNGQLTLIGLNVLAKNTEIADSLFTLDIPEGVDVIDDRPGAH